MSKQGNSIIRCIPPSVTDHGCPSCTHTTPPKSLPGLGYIRAASQYFTAFFCTFGHSVVPLLICPLWADWVSMAWYLSCPNQQQATGKIAVWNWTEERLFGVGVGGRTELSWVSQRTGSRKPPEKAALGNPTSKGDVTRTGVSVIRLRKSLEFKR